jgi:hypothetical protein
LKNSDNSSAQEKFDENDDMLAKNGEILRKMPQRKRVTLRAEIYLAQINAYFLRHDDRRLF